MKIQKLSIFWRPNAPDEDGKTPIYWAALNGHTDIIKILTPMTSNPNFSTVYGVTPIRNAARKGHTEIVQILASLTDNVNVPSNLGFTPIFWAAFYGHIEVIKVLAPLTENANSPNNSRETPIYWAATAVLRYLLCKKNEPELSLHFLDTSYDGQGHIYKRKIIRGADLEKTYI